MTSIPLKRPNLTPDLVPAFARDVVNVIPGEYALLSGLVIGVADISPDAAAYLLEIYGNKDNRNFVRANLIRITEAMRDHAFRLNGESVIFSGPIFGSTILLLDGHHRLKGCVDSNEAFRSVVILGVETETITTLDAGTGRTDAHRLTMDGRRSGDILNSAIHYLASFCRSQSLSRSGTLPYHTKVNYWLAGNPRLEESVDFSRTHKTALGFYRSPSSVAFLHYVTTAANAALADVFWNAIVTKQNPPRPGGNAIGLLIDRLVNEIAPRIGASKRVLDHEKRSLYTFMAWNAFSRGEDISKLQFPPGGKTPHLIGLKYLVNNPILYDFSYNPTAEHRCSTNT